jgi:CRP-like cAMP-binding protein
VRPKGRNNIINQDTTTGGPEAVRAIILGHPFFKNLNPHYLQLLVDRASLARFGPGQDIFREGGPADRFYLIHQGRVSLETFVPRSGATTVQTIDAGGALGWSWLYPPYQWQFSARAVEAVEAVAFDAVGLREQAAENHDFGYDLLLRVGRVMLETLQGTRHKLVQFYVRDLVE